MVTASPQVAGLAPTIGRDSELRDLRLAFQSSAVQVLTGMGGVGKTSLARAYAQAHIDSYSLIWWVRAEDPAAIDAEFRSLLEVLLPPGEAAQITDARIKAFDLLAHHNGPWLLVLDNVPDAAASNGLLPPAGDGHVLITSRAVDWPTLTAVEPLGAEAAVELLIAQSADQDTVAAKILTTELGGLPLALTQAASFARTNAIDLATYLRLYRERSAELHDEGRPPDYPHTVATTWQLALDRLSGTAREMLNVFAFYAPDAIPVHLLFASTDELTRHRALGELHTYSLITHAGSNTVTVHRLVQAVTRNRLYAELTSHEWADKARGLIMTAMPEEPVTAISLAAWNALRTHVHSMLDYLPPEHPATLSLRHELAQWTAESGDAVRARELLAELLVTRERVLGKEHPHTLVTLHNLAFWTGHAGDPEQARDLLAGLLQMEERLLGPNEPSTLITRHNLASWTGEAGNPAEARDLFAELCSIRERVSGAKHSDTLIARSELASWTGQAGDAVRARELFAELLPVRQQALGIDHPESLITGHKLAYWTGEAGDASHARDLFAELLPVRQQVLGVDHHDTLSTQYELAYWTGEAGDAARARELLTELLPIQVGVLGAQHPHTLRTELNLAYWTEELR